MPDDAPLPKRFKRLQPVLLAAGGYLVLSCFYAWRVIVHFSTHLAGHGGDGWQNLWNMWWFKQALVSGQNPYFTDMLHHPTGITLLFQTLNPFNCALALPIDLVLGQPIAYNIVFLFSFAASGFSMYLLVHELTGHRAGAFVSGCVFTFSHFHFAHAQGHMQLLAMEWLPLFLFFLVRVWRVPRWPNGLWLGVCLALTTFCSFYYLVAGVLIALFAMVTKLVGHRTRVLDKNLVGSVGLGAAVFLATAGILLLAMLIRYAQGDMLPAHDARFWSTDLQAFFVPPWISAYGQAFAGIWSRWTGNSAECSQYLGYSVITLSIFGFVFNRAGERPWAWAALLGFGMILSMGPVLHWGGEIHDDIPLPYKLLDTIFPFLRMSGAPVRFHVITLLGSAVLAGVGVAAICRRVGERRLFRLPGATLTAAGICVLVLIELHPQWVEVRPLLHPDFIQDIQEAPADQVVYDLGDGNEALLRQTGHHHKMIGGYVSRSTRPAQDFIKRTPVLRALRGHGHLSAERVRSDAKTFGLRFLLIPYDHRAKPSLPALGLRKLATQWGTDLWEIPWEPAKPGGPSK